MQKIYFDNSSTSLPKAPGVAEAMSTFLEKAGYNVGRGGYSGSLDIAMDILLTREYFAQLFSAERPREVIFTPGLTTSLNMILSGFLKEGDHVITSSMEHNSVMRPLHALSTQRNISYDVASCDSNGALDPQEVIKLIKPNTKAIVMTHASNVCGTIMPIREIGQICAEHNLRFILDAAQTAGLLDINMQRDAIDVLAFPGHKALLGPQGVGGFVIKEDFAKVVNPIMWGGTGSRTADLDQPDSLPDKFESGTMNIPGILGLKAAVEYIIKTGQDTIYQQEMKLCEHFIAGAKDITDMKLIAIRETPESKTGTTLQEALQKIAVVSVDFPKHDNARITAGLDKQFGIMARCGMHCAPAAHKTLGTYPQGTLRFSFGHANTLEEVDFLLDALRQILNPQD